MAPDSASLSPRALALVGIVVVLALLYSVFIMAAPLAWASAVVPLVALYLLWRFVRAHERIAAAMESSATTEPGANE